MRAILYIDAVINLALGLLLLFFSPSLASSLGVPPSSTGFYPNVLGGIFIGITIALVIEATNRKPHHTNGLGLTGAISINLCGGTTLGLWLILGDLHLPTKGMVFLWALVIVLVVVSGLELLRFRARKGIDKRADRE